MSEACKCWSSGRAFRTRWPARPCTKTHLYCIRSSGFRPDATSEDGRPWNRALVLRGLELSGGWLVGWLAAESRASVGGDMLPRCWNTIRRGVPHLKAMLTHSEKEPRHGNWSRGGDFKATTPSGHSVGAIEGRPQAGDWRGTLRKYLSIGELDPENKGKGPPSVDNLVVRERGVQGRG